MVLQGTGLVGLRCRRMPPRCVDDNATLIQVPEAHHRVLKLLADVTSAAGSAPRSPLMQGAQGGVPMAGGPVDAVMPTAPGRGEGEGDEKRKTYKEGKL